MIYLNHGLSRPLDRRVGRAMAAFLEESANDPTLLPVDTGVAEAALENARQRVAALAGVDSAQVLFASGATEANNLAIKGLGLGAGDEILIGATEHTSVQYPARTLQKQGVKLRWLPVDHEGRLDPGEVKRRIGARTRLVAVCAAEPETGTLQPVEEIGAVCRGRGVALLVDAAAAAGQIPLEPHAWGADLLSLSAHKFAGPRGVGALIVRPGQRLWPLIEGGVQEGGRRGGTENLTGIAGMGEAAALALRDGARRSRRLRDLRDRLWEAIRRRIPGSVRHGCPGHCLPGHLSLSFPGAEGEALLLGLWRRGIVASSGSACFAHTRKPSYVLRAMGVSEARAQCSVLFTLGEELQECDIETIASVTADTVNHLRGLSATVGRGAGRPRAAEGLDTGHEPKNDRPRATQAGTGS